MNNRTYDDYRIIGMTQVLEDLKHPEPEDTRPLTQSEKYERFFWYSDEIKKLKEKKK